MLCFFLKGLFAGGNQGMLCEIGVPITLYTSKKDKLNPEYNGASSIQNGLLETYYKSYF
jgi:hypothetical protein